MVDKGKSQTPKSQVGENLYNRAVMNAVLIAEGIRTAQKLTGKKLIDGADMRRGLEFAQNHRRALETTGSAGLCRADPSELLRPQRPRQCLSRAVGRHEVDERVGFNRADLQQGSAADRECGRAVRESQRRVAEANRALR